MTTADTMSQGSQPCQGAIGEAVLGKRRFRDPEFRIGRRTPNLQEQQRDDERAERGEHVGQRVVEEVRGDELRGREAAARGEQDGPQRADRAHAAVDRHDVERQDQRHDGQLTADHRAERSRWQAGDRAEHCDWNAQRAEGDWRRIEDQHEDQGLERREAHENEQRAGDRHRRAEPGDALKQRAEAEADDDQHHAPVVRKMLDDPGAEGVEPAGPHRDVVEEQRVDDDPHHRPKRKDGAGRDRVDREPDRHLPDRDGYDQPCDERGQSRLPRRPPQDAEKDKDRDDRQDRDKKRQAEAAPDRGQKLLEHLCSPWCLLFLF
jgi:hypothetical protein